MLGMCCSWATDRLTFSDMTFMCRTKRANDATACRRTSNVVCVKLNIQKSLEGAGTHQIHCQVWRWRKRSVRRSALRACYSGCRADSGARWFAPQRHRRHRLRHRRHVTSRGPHARRTARPSQHSEARSDATFPSSCRGAVRRGQRAVGGAPQAETGDGDGRATAGAGPEWAATSPDCAFRLAMTTTKQPIGTVTPDLHNPHTRVARRRSVRKIKLNSLCGRCEAEAFLSFHNRHYF